MQQQKRSFQNIMTQLHELKLDALHLHYIYSPKTVNFHQIIQIKQLQSEVQIAQQKLTHFQSQLLNSKRMEQEQQKELFMENQQLLNINQQLVKSNDRFKDILEKTTLEKQTLQEELQRQIEVKKNSEVKHNKQIENLKLMQAQELYILKKKEKKT